LAVFTRNLQHNDLERYGKPRILYGHIQEECTWLETNMDLEAR